MMGIRNKLRYYIYSIFNMDVAFRKEKFLKWERIVKFIRM